MDLSTIGISVAKLSNSTNYVDIYDVLHHQKIITVLELKDKSLILLLSNGKFIRYNPNQAPSKLFVESIWEQFISYEVISAVLLENYPCIFYLSNQSILYLRTTEGNINTAQSNHIIASTLTLYHNLLSFSYNSNQNLLIALSSNHIQVLSINKKHELIPFAPFQPSCQKFVSENAVIFSKRFDNIIYYLDYLQEPFADNISFSKEASTYYILKKCIIDATDISEVKLNILSYESELISYDINNQETFVFLTVQEFLYILKGTKTFGIKVLAESELGKVRWNNSSMLIIVISITSEVYIFDTSLNQLNILSNSLVHPFLSLSSDGLLKNIQFCVISSSIILMTPVNVAACKFLENFLVPIPSHLRQGNFIEALSCLEALPPDLDFASGFYLC